ncbi:hypothetical protein DP144_02020 [Clostridium tetani]|uniref:hypothetical protein n=1 Tax=Clostridium tetani TaxID=1513 RepID=UPI00100A75C3|nr:hypothetical protein [Clostridium tetani]RXM79607.1 hypothetical protein DP154_02015 [Clostridium tetani]RYV00421.1 hypothetical protein DP144_02020 [Clostridium tetani]
MANPAFKSLLESINAQIKSLNENDLKVYDGDNPEFFITGIEYRQDEDKLIFKTDEDPEEFKRIHQKE